MGWYKTPNLRLMPGPTFEKLDDVDYRCEEHCPRGTQTRPAYQCEECMIIMCAACRDKHDEHAKRV